VLGHYNTDHLIKPPERLKEMVGLTARQCADNAGKLALLSEDEIALLRNQARARARRRRHAPAHAAHILGLTMLACPPCCSDRGSLASRRPGR